MHLEHPPQGLRVSTAGNVATIAILPYLTESGRDDVQMLRYARYIVIVVGGVGLVAGGWFLRILALGVLVAGFAWMIGAAWRDARRQRATLEVVLGPAELRVVERI